MIQESEPTYDYDSTNNHNQKCHAKVQFDYEDY